MHNLPVLLTRPRIALAPSNLIATPEFTSGWSASNGVLTPNAVSNPNGQMKGATWRENTAAGTFPYVAIAKAASPVAYRAAVYAKRVVGERNLEIFAQDNVGFASGVTIKVNLGTGAIMGAAAIFGGYSLPSGSVKRAPNGWWLIELFFTTNSAIGFNLMPRPIDAAASDSYTGDGVSTVGLWDMSLRAL